MHGSIVGLSKGKLKALDLDHGLRFVKSAVVLWVASKSVPEEWLQCFGWAGGASTHSAGDEASHHCQHQHSSNNADSDDLRQGVSTGWKKGK